MLACNAITYLANVVVLEESPCPRRPISWIYKSLSSDTNPRQLSRTSHSANSPLGLISVWSCDVHKFDYRHRGWGYGEECLI